MKNMKAAFVAAVVASTSLLVGGCSAATGNTTSDCTPDQDLGVVSQGTIKVAVVPVPNITDIDNGNLTGLEGDILNGFAKEHCLRVEPNEIAGQGIIPAVQKGLVDVGTGGWMDTKERREVIGFSATTFVDTLKIVSKKGYKSLDELRNAGATVGSPQGNWWVKDVSSLLGPKFKVYQDFDETLLDVSAGRLDAAIVTSSSTLEFMKSPDAEGIQSVSMERTESLLDGGDLSIPASFPVGKDEQNLTRALDSYLSKIKGDGTLDSIISKWGMPPLPKKG